MLCSAALALACLLPLAAPLAWGVARLVATGLARWAWELATQAAWEYLAGRLLLIEPASLPSFAANTTLAETVPAILLGAGRSTETIQTVGSVWTWSCYVRSGGMAEDARKELRARPLTSEARQPEPLPCAVCWALYLEPACTCGSGGAPRTVPSGAPRVVTVDAAPALTRPGLGAARAPPPQSRQGD